ncbi:MAG: sphingosine kinase, partial [Actinomycetota bacterium]|nr:sphingosine kinase [Actinomycetota bacterium]
VTERANRMAWPRGRAPYDLAAVATLRAFRPVPYVVTVDGTTVHSDAMLVAVGNGPAYGGGMRVCPGAIPPPDCWR